MSFAPCTVSYCHWKNYSLVDHQRNHLRNNFHPSEDKHSWCSPLSEWLWKLTKYSLSCRTSFCQEHLSVTYCGLCGLWTWAEQTLIGETGFMGTQTSPQSILLVPVEILSKCKCHCNFIAKLHRHCRRLCPSWVFVFHVTLTEASQLAQWHGVESSIPYFYWK